ncbi:unnamed protein product, partial [Didymodactylos carnosus]
YLIYSLKLPSCENQVKRIIENLEECALIMSPMINSKASNLEQVLQLNYVQKLLKVVNDDISSVVDDINNKVKEAKRLSSNSYVSAMINGISTLLHVFIHSRVTAATGPSSYSTMAARASTITHGVSTIGDIMFAGRADHLIAELEGFKKIIDGHAVEHKRLVELEKELRSRQELF